MGVCGLWRLLDSFGQVTRPEAWRGRRVAVDASIWMGQFRAQTKPGCDTEHQILEGFFVRILKLIFYGIHPVFVFDGHATSAKSAEHRRRQLRRHALSQALLKRRAQQIVTAQMSAGVLGVTHAPVVSHEEAEKSMGEPVASNGKKEGSNGDEKVKGNDTDDDDAVVKREELHDSDKQAGNSKPEGRGNPDLVRRCRHGVPAKRRLAPERVSKTLTRMFLRGADEFLAMRRRGEQRVLENQLRDTTSSLFMGPRRVFRGETDENSTTAAAATASEVAAHVSGKHIVVSVDETEESVIVDVEASDVDHGNGDDDSISVSERMSEKGSVVTVASSAGQVEPSDTERNSDVVALTPPSLPGAPTTWHALALVQPTRTPPTKKVAVESGPIGGEASAEVTSSSLSFDADIADGEDEDSNESEDDEEWSLDEKEEDTNGDRGCGGFLWHPNTQIGPPLDTQAPFDILHGSSAPAKGSDGRRHPRRASEDEFVPVAVFPNTAIVAAGYETPSEPIKGTPQPPGSVSFPLPSTSATTSSGTATAARPIPFELLRLVELLDCCGVPYVFSPAEADAQCAQLAREGLVDAVFTEDSDVMVHGAPVVLRGFFASNRHVVEYRSAELAACGVDRRVLVALAYLLGCDYTEGVHGLGLAGALTAVTAAWPSPVSMTDSRVKENVKLSGPAFVCGLLRRWHHLVVAETASGVSWMGNTNKDEDLSLLQHALLSASRKLWATLVVPPGFPDKGVADSFFAPAVDAETAPFPLTQPDWQRMRTFAGGHGLLASSWVVQRYDLAKRAWDEHEAARVLQGGGAIDTAGRQQRSLDEFIVRDAHVTTKWAFKKVPPQLASALAQLRAVQAAAEDRKVELTHPSM